jgi:hypothetical protein
MLEQKKRGKPAKIDLLPESAWPHVKAALQALTENNRYENDIREELNNHLLGLGLDPISRTSFNRKSLQLAKIGADISRAREMAAVFAEKLDEMPEGDVGMLINEMCKVIIYNMTADIASQDLEVAAKLMKEISLAVYRLEQAGQTSTKRRAAIMDRAKTEAGEAVKKVAKEKGISDDTVQAILDKVLVNRDHGREPEKPAAA